MNIEFSNNKIIFDELNIGETFTIPPFHTVMMKTEDVYIKLGEEEIKYNALTLDNGFFRNYSDDEEVIPRRAKIVIDR